MKKLIEVEVAEDRIGDTETLIETLQYLGRELRLQRRDAEAIIVATCVMQLHKLVRMDS